MNIGVKAFQIQDTILDLPNWQWKGLVPHTRESMKMWCSDTAGRNGNCSSFLESHLALEVKSLNVKHVFHL
jgi:hypothetical protein